MYVIGRGSHLYTALMFSNKSTRAKHPFVIEAESFHVNQEWFCLVIETF